MLPYISVIIPSLNRPKSLKQSLYSVLNQETQGKLEFEVIVALDKQDEQSQKWLNEELPIHKRLRTCRSKKAGVNSARNAGFKLSRGEIVYYIDDDCILPRQDHLIGVSEGFNKFSDASAIGGGYILENTINDILSVSRNSLDNFYVEANIGFEGTTGALLGGNTAYKRAILAQCGCFDDNIRYGSAETELNDRILKGGGRLYFMKEMSVLHSPVKQNLISYFLKSFLQGTGKAYSMAKNGSSEIPSRRTQKNMWFLYIARRLNKSLAERAVAAVFLALNSFCFRAGLLLAKRSDEITGT